MSFFLFYVQLNNYVGPVWRNDMAEDHKKNQKVCSLQHLSECHWKDLQEKKWLSSDHMDIAHYLIGKQFPDIDGLQSTVISTVISGDFI